MDKTEVAKIYMAIVPQNDVPSIPIAYPEDDLRNALYRFSPGLGWITKPINGRAKFGNSEIAQAFHVNSVALSLPDNQYYELMPALADVRDMTEMSRCRHYADNFEFLYRSVWNYPEGSRLVPFLVDPEQDIPAPAIAPGNLPVYPMETMGGIARRYFAPIAFNGGFFICFKEQFDQGGIFGEPVGLLIINERLVALPVFSQGCFLINQRNQAFIEKISMADTMISLTHKNGRNVRLRGQHVHVPHPHPGEVNIMLMERDNSICLENGDFESSVGLYTRSFGTETLPSDNARVEITIGRKWIQEVREASYGRTPIPLLSFVLSFPRPVFTEIFGDDATLEREILIEVLLPKIGKIRHAFSGGPLLIHRRQQLSPNAPYDKNDLLWTDDFIARQVVPTAVSADIVDRYAPRTAVGLRRDAEDRQQLIVVTVDGATQREYSGGIKLSQLVEYMDTLGCTDALNLDGGGSSKLLVWGHQVNDPGDAILEQGIQVRKERPTSLALVLRPCR